MELFRLLGTIAVDNEQANRALNETAGQAENTGRKTESAFAGIGKAALGIGKVVLGAGVALGTAWIAAIEGSREYRMEMGKLDTAFVTNGHSSEAATKTYRDLQAVLGETDVSVEAANHLAIMTDNEKDLQTWTDICTGVFATFGDSLPIEGLTEAANETAKVGEVTGPLADALNWAGISEDSFNEKLAACTTEQERQKLIMETLNGTYKKASDQYKETNKDILAANRANEKLTSAFAELGRVGEPILTAIKTKIADMVTAAVPHLENLVKKVKDVKKWVQENRTTINNWKAAIVGAAASAASFVLVLKWSSIMGKAKAALAGVRAAVLLFNVALRANPVGLVISLIAGLVTAFVLLWRNNEGFRNFWIGLWNKIKSVASSVISSVKSKFNDFKSAFNTVKTVFGNIQKTISDKMDAAKDKVRDAIAKIKNLFNFKWSLPKLKTPKITVDGGKAPYGLGGQGRLPSFDIAWRAKGAVFSEPTILNSRLGFQGVGDSSTPEAVAPIGILQGYIREAVRAENGNVNLGRIVIEQTQILMDFLKRTMPHDVVLNGNALVGELLPYVDSGLADRYTNTRRGNVR